MPLPVTGGREVNGLICCIAKLTAISLKAPGKLTGYEADFDHLEGGFPCKEVQFKKFGLPAVKTNCLPAGNVNETHELIVQNVW